LQVALLLVMYSSQVMYSSIGTLILIIIVLLSWSIGTNNKSILISILYFEILIVFSALLFIVLSNQEVGVTGIQGELYCLSCLTVGAVEMGIIISLLVSYYRVKGMLSLTVFNLLC